MNVQYLIQLLHNKLIVLNNAKIQAFNAGDLPTINALDEEILGVQNTLIQLKLLVTLDTAAVSANTTSQDLVASSIEAAQAAPVLTVQGPSASAIVRGYDISAYATDPLHEQKIQSIVDGLPPFTTAEDIDTYIQAIAPGSPVTGGMVLVAVNQYSVDMVVVLAIMQNDSLFGTTGVGARTFNPGNIGNTGTAEYSYPAWADGVTAVAGWLDNHRVG